MFVKIGRFCVAKCQSLPFYLTNNKRLSGAVNGVFRVKIKEFGSLS